MSTKLSVIGLCTVKPRPRRASTILATRAVRTTNGFPADVVDQNSLPDAVRRCSERGLKILRASIRQ